MNKFMKNPQETYKKQRILTASPLELIVMLYDGLNKNIKLAQRAISKNNIESAHERLVKAQDIVNELTNSLDLNIPMSEELLRLYEFLGASLGEANMKKDAELLEPILEITDNLREAWEEINRTTREATQAEAAMLETAQAEAAMRENAPSEAML